MFLGDRIMAISSNQALCICSLWHGMRKGSQILVGFSRHVHPPESLSTTSSTYYVSTQGVHAQLAKAESSLATQIRTKKIGLADFLHRQRVPGVTSPECPCGWHRQTAKHVIMFCPLQEIREHLPRVRRDSDYRQLLESASSLRTITSSLMKTGLLGQFSVAVEQLYQ